VVVEEALGRLNHTLGLDGELMQQPSSTPAE
jgi:hypothetical protein